MKLFWTVLVILGSIYIACVIGVVFCLAFNISAPIVFGKSNDLNLKNDTTIVIIDGTDYNTAVNYIKDCEGFENKPYQCGGYYFVGYGHLINEIDSNVAYTEDQATKLLEYDLQHLIKYVSNLYNLTGTKALAVAMLFYNVSHKSIFSSRLHSELLKPDYKRDYEVIKSNWINLCKFNNKPNQKLIERREFELRLFLKN